MSARENQQHSASPLQSGNNPHKKLHTVVFVLVCSCLTAQVLEGSFIATYILFHFGWPELSLQEVCSEMHGVIYDDPDRYCNFPYPLFEDKPEPWTQKNREDRFGYVLPPRPEWEYLHWRGLVERRDKRIAEQQKQQLSSTAISKQPESSNTDSGD